MSVPEIKKVEILYKVPSFKLERGEFKPSCLVVVRLPDNRVLSINMPLKCEYCSEREVLDFIIRNKLV